MNPHRERKVAAHHRLLHATDASPELPVLYRRRSGRVLAGVSAGLAEHVGVRVLWVRAAFVALSAFFGLGVVAYGLLWTFVPQRAGAEAPASIRERQQGMGLLILGIGLMLAFGWSGLLLPVWLLGPAAVVAVGAGVVWREADESQRRRWRQGATGVAGIFLGGGGRTAAARVTAGTALVVSGITAFLAGNMPLGGAQFVLLAVIAALLGAAVLTVPWWVRLVRDLDVERASRIRSQERAEIAAHLHDSVLQTLALIQKQADSGRDVRRLARAQERELRTWLYGKDGYGQQQAATAAPASATEQQTLSEELGRICGEVEDTFAITVQHVVVGDCDVDDRLGAQLAAAREAVVNAAKHAGVDEVSVYAEAEPQRVSVYVRDRGAGFDPAAVPSDRHGLSDSIRGRMERNGGTARVRTSPGEGTEIQLEMPLNS